MSSCNYAFIGVSESVWMSGFQWNQQSGVIHQTNYHTDIETGWLTKLLLELLIGAKIINKYVKTKNSWWIPYGRCWESERIYTECIWSILFNNMNTKHVSGSHKIRKRLLIGTLVPGSRSIIPYWPGPSQMSVGGGWPCLWVLAFWAGCWHAVQ